MARSSPVSLWVKQPVTKQMQFELRFDDPRLPEEQRVSIQGDRDQLEALHEAVTTYVQDLLSQSPDLFNTVFSPQATPSLDTVESSNPQALDLSNNDSQALSPQPRPLEPSTASTRLDPAVVPTAIATPAREIFLQPSRGLSHELFLGSLATEETGPVVHLSVLQLFDLVTALDEYAADVVALPSLSRPRSLPAMPAWAGITALVVLAAGLMTVMVQIFNQSDSPQTADRSATQGSGSDDQQQTALQPSPVPGVPTPLLASPETLPSPPPVGSLPSPSPSVPSVAVPGATPGFPNTPRTNAPQTVPVTPIPGLKTAPPILINPAPRQDGSFSIPGEATAPGKSGVRSPTPLAPPSAAIPNPSPTTPVNPNLEAALPEANRSGNKPTAGSRDSTTATGTGVSPTQRQSQTTPKGTAFDTIPQVAEVREYFKQQWEPPSGLTQALEYSLVIDVDGTIQRIEPLGQAARNYVDRTGMPLIGERFVSPNKGGQTPRIRIVLAPDGDVQAFLESNN